MRSNILSACSVGSVSGLGMAIFSLFLLLLDRALLFSTNNLVCAGVVCGRERKRERGGGGENA